MAPRDGASSVLGQMIRITPLTEAGAIDPNKPVYTTKGFISASFSPEFEDGDEITEKNASGGVCISYKAPDTLKRLNFSLSLCTPDPEAAKLLAGGYLICDAAGAAIGYSSAMAGATVGNPVAIEVWSVANVGGKPAGTGPYWHWVFPYVKVRYEGDREFGNSALSNEFTGQALGNGALVPAGLNPTNPGGDDYVTYKAALANPFSYVRAASFPQVEGFSGTDFTCDIQAPAPPNPATGVTKGSPGSYTAAAGAADVPVDLAALNTLGALGETVAWADRAIGTVQEWVALGDGTGASWGGVGTNWVPVTTAQQSLDVSDLCAGGAAGWPGTTVPANLGALQGDGTVGDGNGFKADGAAGAGAGVDFATDQFVTLGDSTKAHYASGAWTVGPAT